MAIEIAGLADIVRPSLRRRRPSVRLLRPALHQLDALAVREPAADASDDDPPPAPADDNADKIARLDQHQAGMPTTDIPRVAARNVRNRSVNKRSSDILFGRGP
jgi:hypothetical protein